MTRTLMTTRSLLAKGMEVLALVIHMSALAYAQCYFQPAPNPAVHDCMAKGIAGLFLLFWGALLGVNLGVGKLTCWGLRFMARSEDDALLWSSVATAAGPPLLFGVWSVDRNWDSWYLAALLYPHLFCLIVVLLVGKWWPAVANAVHRVKDNTTAVNGDGLRSRLPGCSSGSE